MRTTISRKLTSTAFFAAIACASANAALITVDNYVYNTSPNGTYPDSGSELTDGITDATVWDGSNAPTASDIAPLVGWLNVDTNVTFNFSATEVVSNVKIWFADSDGVAGVALPTEVTIRTADSSFTQTTAITNPSGSGSMVSFDFSVPSVSTDSLIVSAKRGNQWTMVSEVQFDSIPEPSSTALLGLGGLALLLRRKK